MNEGNPDRVIGDLTTVREVFDALPMLIGGFTGPEHRVEAINAAYRAFAPRLVALGLGARAVDAIPEIEGQSVMEHFDHVYRTGDPLHATEWRMQADLTGDGALSDLYLDFSVTPRRDADNNVCGLQLVLTDVTDRVRQRIAAEERTAQMTELYHDARDSAITMQQALLSTSVPVLPSAAVAAHYLVAAEDTAAGGDWFDAIALPDSRIALVIGDVVGHGVRAASVMAQLRSALRMRILDGSAVSDAVRAVSDFAAHVPGGDSCTVCVGILDTATGCFEYCTAGHPPPLVVPAYGRAYFLPPTGGRPLRTGTDYVTATEYLDIGDAVLLYSDGLIERPGRSPQTSTAELSELATSLMHGGGMRISEPAQRRIDKFCSETLELLLRPSGYSDDVTVLAAQRIPAQESFHAELRVDIEASRLVRGRLVTWLTELGADPANITMLSQAVTEFVDNASQHAYPVARPGSVIVDAELDDIGVVHIAVSDQGHWKTPTNTAHRGRGLLMADTLTNGHTTVRSGDSGTTATIDYPLTRPATIVTDPAVTYRSAVNHAQHDTTFVLTQPTADTLAVAGDIDLPVIATLSNAFNRMIGSGQPDITVDLSDVTFLGSAAVTALFSAHDRAERHHCTLRLTAPPASTAHHVLSVVNFPPPPA